jgi:membrane carboxypeptidase/penicillin-binding protein PbpC
VKTGTSRDFHDSWAVGYTSDYVVGVWIGNAQNEPMNNLSGADGAGTLWRQVMELMETTPYNQHNPFTYNLLENYEIAGSLFKGLPKDVIENHRNLLLDDNVILLPHAGDTILHTEEMSINFVSRQSVVWLVDNQKVGLGKTIFWRPSKPGTYTITAKTGTTEQSIDIEVVAESTFLPQ